MYIYICKTCVDGKEGAGHFEGHSGPPFSTYFGPCESCGEEGLCVRCFHVVETQAVVAVGAASEKG